MTAGRVDHISHLLACLLRFPWKMTILVRGGLTRSRRKTWTGRKKLRRPSLTSRNSPSNTLRSLPGPRKVGCAGTVCQKWDVRGATLNKQYLRILTHKYSVSVGLQLTFVRVWTARLMWFSIHEAAETSLPSQAQEQTRTTYWLISASSTLPLCRVCAPYGPGCHSYFLCLLTGPCIVSHLLDWKKEPCFKCLKWRLEMEYGCSTQISPGDVSIELKN